MANERNAGAKPKFKKDVKTIKIHPTIPQVCKDEVLKSIDKIVEPYKN
jgi:hypothetical protein